MKAFAWGLLIAVACPGLAPAQSAFVDLSKPMTGTSQYALGVDGKPMDLGIPAKPEPAPEPIAATAEEDAEPVIRPAYLRPNKQATRDYCSTASYDPRCGSTRRTTRVYVTVNNNKAEPEKSRPRSGFRLGRRR